jgi:hypothetical protein
MRGIRDIAPSLPCAMTRDRRRWFAKREIAPNRLAYLMRLILECHSEALLPPIAGYEAAPILPEQAKDPIGENAGVPRPLRRQHLTC